MTSLSLHHTTTTNTINTNGDIYNKKDDSTQSFTKDVVHYLALSIFKFKRCQLIQSLCSK